MVDALVIYNNKDRVKYRKRSPARTAKADRAYKAQTEQENPDADPTNGTRPGQSPGPARKLRA